MQILFYIIIFLIGLFFLVGGANFLIQSSARLSYLFHLGSVFIALTVIAIGTSAPEAGVGIVATIKKAQNLALGTIIGSNIANIGLVLGLSGLIKPLRISERLFRIEIPFFILTVFLLFLFSLDLKITFWEGVIFLLVLLIFYLLAYRGAKNDPQLIKEMADLKSMERFNKINSKTLLFIITLICLALVVIGANLMVVTGKKLASIFGISSWIIGITVFAVGTSLPELATTISASYKNVPGISIGNIIGSNIFNILFVLGIISLMKPVFLPISVLKFEIPFLIFFTLLVFIFMKTKKTLSRKESFFLILCYFLFLIILFSP